MADGIDRHAARRAELLAPVAELCAHAGVTAAPGLFRSEFAGRKVQALRCVAADGSWDAAITVVRGLALPAAVAAPGKRYVRDPDTGYDLDTGGELLYEVRICEDDDGAAGHGPRPLVGFELVATPQAAADVLVLWARRAALFRCTIPVVSPEVARRWEWRRYEHRLAAAAAADVEAGGVPETAAGDVAAVDKALLCWHFPRERGGRYQRSAVVALAPCAGPALPHLRGRWLTARAHGDRLVLAASDLIPVNQRHRWDLTPWLWDRRHAGTPPLVRWQAADPGQVRPAFEALRRGAASQALDHVGVDGQIGKLLAGEPPRLSRGTSTELWVTNLYAGLAVMAPWRLAAAHQLWREQREASGLPAQDPVTLFGLGGNGAARKPKVALDGGGTGPVLRLHYTGSNAVLPESLWTLPADLAALLYGWSVPAAVRSPV